MAGTLAFDVKDALVDKLKLEPALAAMAADEAITYGYGVFGAGGRPRQSIWVGEIEWDDEVSVGLGQSRRDEFFRIMLTIECVFPGDTQKEANYRARDLMKVVEAMVRNPRWSGLSVVESELKPQLLGEGPGDNGRAAMLIMSLHVRARKS